MVTKSDGDVSNNELDVDDELSDWESQFGTSPTPLAASIEPATAVSLESQPVALTAEPLPAELVDAAIAVDLASRSIPKSRLGSPATLKEDHFDWISRSTRCPQKLTWQGTSEIGNNSFRDQSSENNDGRFYRDADDEGVNEELRDELFADGELNSLL